ncbi:hypothetical protein Tco_0435684 [Tanacetum coccineum]
MDQDLAHMVAASKVPMLKPGIISLISHRRIHDESISQEDVNQKFLRSLSPEWNTHTIVWRNKPKIDTLSLDDLYNNMKIYEPKSDQAEEGPTKLYTAWLTLLQVLTLSEPTVKKPVVKTSEAKASVDKAKVYKEETMVPLLIEDWISDSEDEAESRSKIEKKTVKPSFAKIEFVKSKEQVKSPRKTTVKQGDQNRLNTHSPRGNQRN